MAIRRRTNAYWAKRADERLLDSEKTSETYRKKVRVVYAEAQRETLKQLKQIYSTYWSKEDGFDKQKLNTLTTISDMNRFVAELKKSGLYDQIPDNYKGRITRLEYLNAQMWLEAHKAGLKQDELVTESNRKVYEDSYYRSIFDVSKGIGSTPAFNTLDAATVNKALEAKFDGKNYSERIWGNSDILASQLQAKLAVAIATGQSIHKTAREFRERFHVQNYYAERLIRTETNYFHNSAEIESYKSMGFEYFQFLATLDNRTSEICQDMDGKKFKVSEGMPGENIPPLHPNCRSTIVPYFNGYEPGTRIYRDPKTGKNQYTYNMTYDKWLDTLPELQQGEKIGAYKPVSQTLKKMPKREPVLTKEEQYALNYYISSSSYVLNDSLRNRIKLDQDGTKIINDLDSLLDKMNNYRGNVIKDLYFYSGEARNECVSQFKVGSVFSNKEYWSSTTMDEYIPNANVRIFIESVAGKDIRKYNPEEQEILFKRNSKFFVEKIDESDYKCVKIYVKEINDE